MLIPTGNPGGSTWATLSAIHSIAILGGRTFFLFPPFALPSGLLSALVDPQEGANGENVHVYGYNVGVLETDTEEACGQKLVCLLGAGELPLPRIHQVACGKAVVLAGGQQSDYLCPEFLDLSGQKSADNQMEVQVKANQEVDKQAETEEIVVCEEALAVKVDSV